jgi:hypothetical protein
MCAGLFNLNVVDAHLVFVSSSLGIFNDGLSNAKYRVDYESST